MINKNIRNKLGFTIVELLIVIVVIGILAAITIVAFNGVQQRARDSQRLSDASAINKALRQHQITNGSFPGVSYSGLGSQGGWEVSAREASGQFIAQLRANNFSSGVPVDPINNAIENSDIESRANGSYGYYYHVYAAGTHGCDINRGRYYVFGVLKMEGVNGVHPSSPGFACDRNWQSNYAWVTGAYEN